MYFGATPSAMPRSPIAPLPPPPPLDRSRSTKPRRAPSSSSSSRRRRYREPIPAGTSWARIRPRARRRADVRRRGGDRSRAAQPEVHDGGARDDRLHRARLCRARARRLAAAEELFEAARRAPDSCQPAGTTFAPGAVPDAAPSSHTVIASASNAAAGTQSSSTSHCAPARTNAPASRRSRGRPRPRRRSLRPSRARYR